MSEKRTLGFTIPNRGITLLTESGYLLLVKTFTDDLAWEIQRKLVNSYFRSKDDTPSQDLSQLISAITILTEKFCKLENQQTRKKLPGKRKKSRWLTNTFKNMNLFLDFAKENENMIPDKYQPKFDYGYSLSWVIYLVTTLAEDLNENIDFSDYKSRYEYEHDCECEWNLTYIEYYPVTKQAFTEALDALLDSIGISGEKKQEETLLEHFRKCRASVN